MNKQKGIILIFLVASLMAMDPLFAEESKQSEREEMYHRYLELDSYVKGGSIEPHWMADGSSFWYAEGAPGNTVIYKVDPKANTKTPLFDTARLRKAIASRLGHDPPHADVPFTEFLFLENETAVRFTVEDKGFVLQLDTYDIALESEDEKKRLSPQSLRGWGTGGTPGLSELLSPDECWYAHFKDHNLWLRSRSDGRMKQLTTDGSEDHPWVGDRIWNKTWTWWTPDSSKLAVTREDKRGVPKTPIVHWLKPSPEVEWEPATIAGGAFPQVELFIIDVLSKRRVRVDTGSEADQYLNVFGWLPGGSELLFAQRNREHTSLKLMRANATTGKITQVIVSETTETFFPPEWSAPITPTILEDQKCLIWPSERDGWNHLYLYNLDGKLLRRLTKGAHPVVRVVTVDEKEGWVYFTAQDDRQRPYDTHLLRVRLDGTGLKRLTNTAGQHDLHSAWTPGFSSSIAFSPSKQYFLDTHSTPTQPPIVDLRKADGTLVRTLSKANIEALERLGWKPPEHFVVKADDGKTDLYGILYKPFDFDPKKKYPVVEWIYAGPQTPWVAQGFMDVRGLWPQAMAQLDFVVFAVDGRGTPRRGKRFQDVVYRNFGRHEIPDHVAALKQVARKRPYMDMSRVGVFGASWGGYMTLRALFTAPEVYRVGVALAPIVEAYTRAEIHEPYMGLPSHNKEGYEYASNLRLAGSLKGKLLLVVGTSDGLFADTMKMVDALVQADKEFDLLVVPEQGHGVGGKSGKYMLGAVGRFLQKHLRP